MPPPNVVDLEIAIRDWAWGAFMAAQGKGDRKHKFNDVRIEVKWDRVEFSSLEPTYINKHRIAEGESKIVFDSTYENLTSTVQDNSFTTDRTTTSTCTASVERGFTKGMHLEMKLAVPAEIMEVTTGFGREIHLNRGIEETQERTLTWSANSSIRIKEGHRVKASLEVKEENFKAEFSLDVRIRGRMLAVLTNLKDNNSFLYAVEGDIVDILDDKWGKEGYFTKEGRTILWGVRGKCDFCYGVKQHVRVEEEPINP